VKRHRWVDGQAGGLIAVNGGPDEGGWFIANREVNERKTGIFRRYYPPGYTGLGVVVARVLVRYRASPREWWVQTMTGPHAPDIGPFPDKASAYAAWRLLK
jgi:hypothetical protein